MSNDIRQSPLDLGPEPTERYVDRAHRLRREFIRRGVRQSLAGLHRGLRRSLARMGGAFRPIEGRRGVGGAHWHRTCDRRAQ